MMKKKMASKKDKDLQALNEFRKRFEQYSDEKLLQILHLGFSNKFASQAINIILEERGLK